MPGDLDRRSGQFLSRLVHELRNPLASLAAASRLLSKAADRPEMAAMARANLDKQVELLASLLQELSEAAQIAQGRVSLQRERHDLVAVLQAAALAAQSSIHDRQVRIVQDFPGEPLLVLVDRARLERVFAGLIIHALHSLPAATATVKVGARVRDRAVEITVQEGTADFSPTGSLDLFGYLPDANGGVQQGLGFELAVSRSLLEQHDGTISAQSAAGTSKRFLVRLPVLS